MDASNAARVLDALDDYAANQGATLIVVSHDRDVMARFGEVTDISDYCAKAQDAQKRGDHA